MRRSKSTGFLLVLPSAFLIISILILPIFYIAWASIHRFDNLAIGGFIGLRNFISIFNNETIHSSIYRGFANTFLALSIAIIFGIISSLWIFSKKGTFAYFLELLSLIPWFTSFIVTALTWRWLINFDFGPINYILKSNNLPALNILEIPYQAFLALSFIMAWRTTGYVMILVLSGLKSLSTEMLEAAKVDGTSYMQSLFYIIFPNIKPQIILAFIMITLSNINNSTIPLAFSGGGPVSATDTVALQIYKLAFMDFTFDRAATLSIILLLINFVIILFYMGVMRYEK